ncbi:hypothetical protein H1Q59_08210 [Holosporaceae bacterium 'Namur']|nr:hypothetical protein [Holosporaceae bacterium 'Namur']
MGLFEDMENKDVVVRLRLSKTNYEHIKKEASLSHLNISDYIRIRLFDFEQLLQGREKKDNKNRFNCDHDREMMRLMVRACSLIQALADKSLEDEETEELENDAITLLRKWGYEND